MALQAAVSTRPAEAPKHTNTRWIHTHTRGVQRVKGYSQQTLRMQPFERGLSLSQNVSHPRLPPLPRPGCCVLKSEGRIHTNGVWLTDWIAGGLKLLAV